MPATTARCSLINAQGLPGAIDGQFPELDLPEIYKLAQRAFGRCFKQLRIDGVVVRDTVNEIKIGRFLGELARFYHLIPDTIQRAAQLNMTPMYPSVKLKGKDQAARDGGWWAHSVGKGTHAR